MHRACQPAGAQRGITLIGLLLWAIVVAFVALIVVRVVPTVNEYSTILRAVQKDCQGGAVHRGSGAGSLREAEGDRVLDREHRRQRNWRSPRRTTRS